MIARKLVLRSLIHGGNYNRPISIADFVRWPMEGGNAFEALYWRRTAMTFMRMSTASSSEVETTALTEEEKERKERSITEGKKSDKNVVVSSYWGVSKPRITREDGTEWPWNCFMVIVKNSFMSSFNLKSCVLFVSLFCLVFELWEIKV